MINFFKTKRAVGKQVVKGVQPRGYVHAVTIEGVKDPFDTRELWERARPLLGDTSRIKGLLDRHAFRVGRAEHVFAHLIVELPADEVEHDRRVASGKRGESLAAELQKLHLLDFGKRLVGGASPRYRVCPGYDLADDAVRIRFGHTVFVATESDQPAWKIECSMDGAIWNHCADIMQAQRLMMLGRSAASASVVVKNWPFGHDCSVVLVNEPQNPQLEISSEPFKSLSISMDDTLGCFVLTSRANILFYLRATRLIPVKQDVPAVEAKPLMVAAEVVNNEPREPHISILEQCENDEDFSRGAGTFVPLTPALEPSGDGTFVPMLHQERHAITLVGLAIQRVSSYGGHGIRGFSFGFDSDGHVVAATNRAWQLGFYVDFQDAISVETRSGRRQVAIGEQLPLPSESRLHLEYLPSEMADRYLAWCALPRPMSEPLGVGARFTIGRDQPVLKNLCILAGKGFLDTDNPVGGDRMGLSRNAFSIEIVDEGLEVMPRAKSQEIWHLDDKLAFVGRLDTKKEQPSVIPTGHHIVVGHYLLRYDA